MAGKPATVDGAGREAALRLMPVSRETEAKLILLVEELVRWQKVKNLISPSTVNDIWLRHVADSLQLLRFAEQSGCWIDLGSGGGFPGLILAIQRSERGLGRTVLVESNGRKCAFLRYMIGRLKVDASVMEARIEALPLQALLPASVVSARALASLAQLLSWSNELLRRGAVGVFPKGQEVNVEIAEATRLWTFSAELHPSMTSPSANIVVVRMAKDLEANS